MIWKRDDGVDLHGDVILGDDRLGSKVRHLLLQGDFFCHPLDEWDLQMQSYVPDGPERAQAFDDIGPGLLDDDDVGDDDDQHQDHQDGGDDPAEFHTLTSVFSSSFVTKSLTPSMFSTRTRLPAGITVPSALRADQVFPSA